MRVRQLVVGVGAMFALGCGHELALTSAGTRVQHVDRAHLPDGCRVVGDVSIGIPPDAAVANSEAELSILMRNKAADMGADHIVIERTEPRPQAGGVTHYIGSGVAYTCTAIPRVGEEPATAGGEAGAGAGAGAEHSAETP